MATRVGGPAARQGGPRFAQFKLVLLGESAVGKSSLVLRFVKDQFDEYRESTIGAAFLTQTVSLPEKDATVKFEIWDTAGQERYKSLAPMYYRNANCAVVVYDITQAASLDKAKMWIKELQRQASDKIVIALVGNKLDLVENDSDKRAVSEEDAQTYRKQVNEQSDRQTELLWFEASAKSGQGVTELFKTLANQMDVDKAQRGLRNPRESVALGGDRGEGANTNQGSQNCAC